jgi:hypothetical protein
MISLILLYFQMYITIQIMYNGEKYDKIFNTMRLLILLLVECQVSRFWEPGPTKRTLTW